jgi:hypothetical protein
LKSSTVSLKSAGHVSMLTEGVKNWRIIWFMTSVYCCRNKWILYCRPGSAIKYGSIIFIGGYWSENLKEGERLLGGPRCRWDDNIKMHLREIGWEGVDWIHLA